MERARRALKAAQEVRNAEDFRVLDLRARLLAIEKMDKLLRHEIKEGTKANKKIKNADDAMDVKARSILCDKLTELIAQENTLWNADANEVVPAHQAAVEAEKAAEEGVVLAAALAPESAAEPPNPLPSAPPRKRFAPTEPSLPTGGLTSLQKYVCLNV